MITAEVKVETNFEKVAKAADKAAYRNLGHAAGSIRKAAAASIERAPRRVPSDPGEPPHTHRRVFLRRAIRFHVDRQKQEAVIGPRASVVGDVGQVLEFGGTRGDSVHPPRPFMEPALRQNLSRFAAEWIGSIGE